MSPPHGKTLLTLVFSVHTPDTQMRHILIIIILSRFLVTQIIIQCGHEFLVRQINEISLILPISGPASEHCGELSLCDVNVAEC